VSEHRSAQPRTRIPTWRPGTTSSASDTGDDLSVLCDGDTATVPAVNATGFYVPASTRVLVLFTPPHGIWVAHVIQDGFSVAEGLVGIEFPEIDDPAAPDADQARLYVRDNGAGKTQLVVVFPTGAVQVIATEP
jgi:hypothetical protein